MLYDDKKLFNHYLDMGSALEVQIKGVWKRITWVPGPGGMMGIYDEDRSVPENRPGRLILPSEKVVPIRR